VARETLWSRLSRMSWDELSTRLRQETGKRLDVALYRAGRLPKVDQRPGPNTEPGKFFFSSDELPERVRLLQQYLPAEMEACLREADEICHHRFRLLGYADLDYGREKEIDWHLDAVHDKCTPLIPWYKINFLDFNLAGDHKVTWELNRHQHLVTLAKAWLLARDERYAKESIAQWYSWQRANPYPLGVNWASSLEVAFRSLSWLWMRHLLADCPALPASFGKDLQSALALNGRHIERYLSTYFSPNTHLLGEAVALFFLGTLCPQLSRAYRWKQRGWKIVRQEAQRQVLPDGVYFEQSLYYHVYALDFFLHARVLASRNGCEISPSFDEVIRKMLAVVETLAQAGPPDGFGDDDGGRVFNPRRNRAEHMTDPLSVGAALFLDEGLRIGSTPTEEAIWLLGRDAITAARHSEDASPATGRAFPQGGLYIAASSDPIRQQMVIDAGPQGTGRSGHGHADALSLKLSFANRPWLVDAGTFVYVSDGTSPHDDRQTFRGTRAHNTLVVDGLDQANPEGPFAWSALPIVQAESWIAAATFTFFSGFQSGYERLAQPVRHRRFIFHLHGNLWLVRDVAEGTGSHPLETSWHFAPDIAVIAVENSFVASPQAEDRPSSARERLTLLPVSDPRWKCDLVTEHVSPAYGTKTSARVLRCSTTTAAPAEHAMLLIPSTDNNDTAGKFAGASEQPLSANGPAAVYTYDSAQTVHSMVFGREISGQAKRSAWTFGPWTSDAHFLYVGVKDRRVTHLVCCEATFVHLHGEPVFSRDAPLQYLEWLNRKGERWTNSSDETTARSLSVKAIEAPL
jgi:hypothetical protein